MAAVGMRVRRTLSPELEPFSFLYWIDFEWGQKEKDVVMLCEYIRSSQRRFISYKYSAGHNILPAYIMTPDAEETIRSGIRQTSAGSYLALDPRVVEAMLPYFTNTFGNAASRSHAYGWKAEEAVENARNQVAELINADPREIVWTSGATESDNLAIKGVAHFYHKKGKHIVTSKIEHKAVLDSCAQLEREGYEVTYLAPDADGVISPAALAPWSRR